MNDNQKALQKAGFELKGARRWVHADGRVVIETEGTFKEKIPGKTIRWREYDFKAKKKEAAPEPPKDSPTEPPKDPEPPKDSPAEPPKAKGRPRKAKS